MNANSSPTQRQLTDWFQRRVSANGVRRVASLSAAIATDLGSVREENQDRAAIVRGSDRQGREYALVVVADGIGGMQDGGTCAALTIGTFIAAVDLQAQGAGNFSSPSEEWLREGVHAANQIVFSEFRARGGSTLVALLIRSGAPPYWLSVGDSRVYCTHDRVLTQVSVDDTFAGQLGKSPEEFSEQSQLLQFVGMGSDLEPHIATLGTDSLDGAILTTDGVHYLAAGSGWLGQIVRHAPDPGVCVRRLIDLAKWCGGHDNATVVKIALPVELRSEPRNTYRCLEVWDAYGELQIISAAPPEEASNAIAKTLPSGQNMVSSASPEALLEPVTDQHSGPPIPEQSKSRRGKVPRKPKKSTGKEDKGLEKVPEPELPQLHMEFPTRSN